MLGIDDTFVWLGYVLSIAAAFLCVVYGLTHWNEGQNGIREDDRRWAEHETQMEDKLEN